MGKFFVIERGEEVDMKENLSKPKKGQKFEHLK